MRLGPKLAASFLIIGLALLGMNYFILSTVEEIVFDSISRTNVRFAVDTLQNIEQSMEERAHIWKSYAYDSLLQESLREANVISSQDEERDAYIALVDKSWAQGGGEHIELLNELKQNPLSKEIMALAQGVNRQEGFTAVPEVFVTNKYGTIIALTGKTTDYSQADERWWQKAKREGSFIDQADFDASAKALSTDVLVRVDDINGSFLGVLKAVLRIDDATIVTKRLEQDPTHGKHSSMQFFLVTRDGKVLMSNTGIHGLVPLPEHIAERVLGQPSGSTGLVKARAPTGRALSISYAYSQKEFEQEGLDWVLILVHDSKELLAPMHRVERLFVLTSLLALFVPLLFGLLVAIRVSGKLSRLTQVIEDISTGKMDTVVEQRLKDSGDEIGDLARAFDRTLVSLKLAINGLQTPLSIPGKQGAEDKIIGEAPATRVKKVKRKRNHASRGKKKKKR